MNLLTVWDIRRDATTCFSIKALNLFKLVYIHSNLNDMNLRDFSKMARINCFRHHRSVELCQPMRPYISFLTKSCHWEGRSRPNLLRNPGQKVNSKTFCPGTLCPRTLWPGTLCPMLSKLGTLCPGTLCSGTFWPGFLSRRCIIQLFLSSPLFWRLFRILRLQMPLIINEAIAM